MKNCTALIALVAFLLLPWVCAHAGNADPKNPTHSIIVDPQTKIIYYLESDKRHIAAISPEGKLLWLCKVATINPQRVKICPNWEVTDIRLGTSGTGEKVLYVQIWESGYGGGFIDLKAGVYFSSGIVS